MFSIFKVIETHEKLLLSSAKISWALVKQINDQSN